MGRALGLQAVGKGADRPPPSGAEGEGEPTPHCTPAGCAYEGSPSSPLSSRISFFQAPWEVWDVDWAPFPVVKKKTLHRWVTCLFTGQLLRAQQGRRRRPQTRAGPCGCAWVQTGPSLSQQRHLQAEAPAAGPADTRLPQRQRSRSFWGHVPLVRCVESSTRPWRGLGKAPREESVCAYFLEEREPFPPGTSRILLAFPSV